ncbi:FG-GAP-like repeat-containing protein, partial [Mesorhizobium sp.]|uniref:FG-GAP-like repeat-containing protein n=1 Tax=Mesorhizobium sp. TaxID=1871066 RepID=UPI00257BF0B5
MGNGRDVSETSQRIKAISVTVGSALRSAYRLTYDQAPFSNASRLTAVTRYGTDASIAADGTITGGTAKALGQMTYQNSDGVYGSVALSITPGLGGIARPRDVGDLDADGRDEIFGDYIQRITVGSPQDPSYALKRTKYIYKFNPNGTQGATVSLLLGTTPGSNTDPNPPKFFSVPGRFAATKDTMDFADSAIQSSVSGATGRVTYSATKSIIKTDASLGLTKAACVPTGYQAVCDALPVEAPEVSSASIVTDADGDGIDTLNVKNGGQIVGVGDFLGNGRQQPLYWGSGGTIKKGTLSNGVWQSSGSSFGISCPSEHYSGEGKCVFADVNGDGAADIFRYNGINVGTGLWLSTGIGFKRYDISSMSGTTAVLRDFDNDGRVDVITVGGTITSNPDRTGSIRVFSLRPSSTAMTPVQFTLPAAMSAGTLIGDFNGDGLPDFTNYNNMFISNAGPGNPNLLRSVVAELGGTVAVEYAPSSTWVNNYLPQVVHAVSKLSVGDGRGQTAVSEYTYA